MDYNQGGRIARIYEGLLDSARYAVRQDYNTVTDGRTQVVLTASCNPFAQEMGAASYDVTLSLYVSNITNPDVHAAAVEDIARLLGSRSGTTDGLRYVSYLTYGRVNAAPVADMGAYTQEYILQGTICLYASNGAIPFFDLTTALTVDGVSGTLPITAASFDTSAVVQAPLRYSGAVQTDAGYTKAVLSARGFASVYTAYLRKNALGIKLLRLALKADPMPLNLPVTVTDTIAGTTVTATRTCALTGITLSTQAGGFASVTLTLQEQMAL